MADPPPSKLIALTTPLLMSRSANSYRFALGSERGEGRREREEGREGGREGDKGRAREGKGGVL